MINYYSSELVESLKKLPTPCYIYDKSLLLETLKRLKQSNSKNFKVHYALKANANEELLKEIHAHGLGADCVSGNEVKRAVSIGFHANEIVFAGVGKSDDEINFSLDQDILCFNVESIQEIEVINQLAGSKGKRAKIALRLNPNIDAYTHKYITTGLEENKFGINAFELDGVLEKIKLSKNIELIGLHFHIGSQIIDLGPFKNLCLKVNEFINWFEHKGIQLKLINVGGGLGIQYKNVDQFLIPDFESYFNVFNRFLELRDYQELHFELGRAIVGQCGSLLTKVLYIKEGINIRFAILDAGMTELIRPALYQSYHQIQNISAWNDAERKDNVLKYDVVGPICESSDCFGKSLDLPQTKRGDLLLIRSAGAYGEVMASGYNLRDKAPSVIL